jgi:hypothetical protein
MNCQFLKKGPETPEEHFRWMLTLTVVTICFTVYFCWIFPVGAFNFLSRWRWLDNFGWQWFDNSGYFELLEVTDLFAWGSSGFLGWASCCFIFILADIPSPWSASLESWVIVSEAYTRPKAQKLSRKPDVRCIQTLPSPLSWTVWRKVIQLLTLPKQKKLEKHCGALTSPIQEIRTLYSTYRTETHVYTKRQNGF